MTRLELPRYPELARQASIEGQAEVVVDLDEHARVEWVKLRRGNPLFEAEVAEPLRKSTFRIECGGKRLSLKLVFRLRSTSSVNADLRVVLEPPDQVTLEANRPAPQHSP